ncbi:iron ABC transporter permease [Devosia sp. 2618]|uniref:FecCD family ABC transporter permease n=1 Tax=Devosia sp. 2618 TaxID=3156454 RepID=UPI00339A71BD
MTALSVPTTVHPLLRATSVCLLLLALTIFLALLSMSLGAVPLSLSQVVDGLFGGADAFIINQYRLPRVVISLMSGAALAVAGLLLQGALRNPLASPDVVGITKGAGLGAMLAVIFLPPIWQVWAIPVGVVGGAGLAAGLLLLIGRGLGGGVTTLALVGVAIGALAQAAMQYLMVRFPGGIDQSMVWLAGSVYGSNAGDIRALSIWLLACLPAVLIVSSMLDLSAFGDDSLTSLGISPGLLRAGMIVTAVALTAGAVASVGSIGFLGLLAPHIARLMVGSRAVHLLPATALVGSLAMLLADLLGRLVALPNEIPAGIVASVIGGPYLLFLLLWEARRRG